VSGFSGWSLYKADEKAIVNDFKKDVDERSASLYREVTINLETLHSLSVMFSGDTIPTFRQFSSEAKKILSRHHDIQALEWIPRVLHSERVLYETRNRQDFPGFQITERESQGHMVRAKERAEYYPVYYVEPLIGNEAAFGFDLASNPTRYEALENSRDYNCPLATARIKLVQENESQKGFLAFLPLYKDKLPTEGISYVLDSKNTLHLAYVHAFHNSLSQSTSPALQSSAKISMHQNSLSISFSHDFD